jgi:hypothetical protein
VSVALAPLQIVTGGETVAAGTGFTVTVMLVSSLQLPLVTITEYVVFVLGLITMDDVVAPVLHENPVPPEALSVAFCPEQIVVFPETLAVMLVVTVTVATAVAVQLPAVTNTV